MALQECKEPDVYQENFEPTSYLEYYRMNQDPVGDEVLHFLLKHYNATFKPGAGLLQPWGRFVGGRVATQILNQMLIFFHCRAVFEWEWERMARPLIATWDLQRVWLCPTGRFYLKKNLFYYLFLAVLVLPCGMWVSSNCNELGLLFVEVYRLLTAVATLVAEHGV